MTKKKSTPKKKRLKAPIKRVNCKARVKTCRNKECRIRFKAGDKSLKCHECGTSRKCTNKALIGSKVCRVHGSGGDRPERHGKMIVPVQIADAFNQISTDSELMSLALNQAMIESRTDQLLQRVNDNDSSGAHRDISAATIMIETSIKRVKTKVKDPETGEFKYKMEIDTKKLLDGVELMKKSVDPVQLEYRLWSEIKDNMELTRRINDTERKWSTAHEQLLPVKQVVEAMAIHAKIALKFIAHADKPTYAREMRALMPSVESE